MIAVVTDSNAQLPPVLVDRYGVKVVALTVTVDGTPFREGFDLDADAFYGRFANGASPTVTTAAPSPGQFIEAYRSAAEAGATAILSVHIGSNASATINAAHLGAEGSPIPVRIVDTGTASFGVGCCAWEAAEALAAGASLEEAAQLAEHLAPSIVNVFVVGAVELARAGGRLAPGAADVEGDAAPVLSLKDGVMERVGQAHSTIEAAQLMASYVLRAGADLRIGIGVADASAAPLWQALEAQLTDAPGVREVIRYRIGPSVGAHTGPSTAGAFAYPISYLTAAHPRATVHSGG